MVAKKASGSVSGADKLVPGLQRKLAIIIGDDHHPERTRERLELGIEKLKKHGGTPSPDVIAWQKAYEDRQKQAAKE